MRRFVLALERALQVKVPLVAAARAVEGLQVEAREIYRRGYAAGQSSKNRRLSGGDDGTGIEWPCDRCGARGGGGEGAGGGEEEGAPA